MSHVTHLGYQVDSCRQELGPCGSRYSDHVLAQARLTGLLRCVSTWAGAGQQRLDLVLAQAGEGPVAVQRRCCRTQVVRAFFLDSCGMGVTGASEMPEGEWPSSSWGWSEYGVLTRPRLSPRHLKDNHLSSHPHDST